MTTTPIGSQPTVGKRLKDLTPASPLSANDILLVGQGPNGAEYKGNAQQVSDFVIQDLAGREALLPAAPALQDADTLLITKNSDGTEARASALQIAGYVAPATNAIAQQAIQAATPGILSQAAQASVGSAASAAQSAAQAANQVAIAAAANRIYATTALGIAATTNGQYFYVPSTNSQGAFDVWENVSGVATSAGITLPNLPSVQATSAAFANLNNRTGTLRFVPLSQTQDTVWGVCVDGVYQTYIDSTGTLHAGTMLNSLPQLPQALRDVTNLKAAVQKVLPLVNGQDVTAGVVVDGVMVAWYDSLGVFHSNHTHVGLDKLPQALSNQATLMGVAPKVLPLAPTQDYTYGWIVDGAYVAWVDHAGVFHSTHTHTEFAQFAQIRDLATKVLPLAKNQDYVAGTVIDGVFQTWVDSLGVFHSTHTHPEIAPLQASVTAIQNQLNSGALGGNSAGYIVEQVAKVNTTTSNTEQQVMVIDGQSPYRQLTKTGYNWRAPIVHHNSAVRCISDYFFSGGNDAVTLLPTGEIVPEPLVVAHYPVYGQSLALGARGFVTWTGDATNGFTAATVFSNTPSVHGNLCLAFGDGTTGYPRTGTVFNKFGVLQEAWSGVVGETVCSGFANSRNDKLLQKWGMRQRILATSTGLGGTPYSGLQKGTAPYNSLIASVSGGKSTAAASGWKYYVPALYIIHGESESGNIADTTYAGYLLQWITDFTSDIMPITGQNQPPVLILSQMNRQKSTNEGVTLGQVLAHDNNANIVLIGPKYQHTYYDDAHMLAEGYVKQGEYGERASRHWLAGRKWAPLKPVTWVGSGNTVTIQFNNTLVSGDTVAGPVGALALDTTVVTNPGNYGFEYNDGAGNSVASVALGADGTSVVLTLSANYVPGATIQYAMQSVLNLNTMPTGQNTGSRGCLRDTDVRDVSRFDNTNLYNWCVAFRKTLS